MRGGCEIGDKDVKGVILDRGGRFFSLFLGDLNVFWTNPNLRRYGDFDEWNIGGERTWIAPERAFFYKNPSEFQGWHCQEGLDPDSYRIEKCSSKNVVLKGKITIKNYETGEILDGDIIREIKLRDTRITGDYTYAHFGIISELRARDVSNNFALWDILQVPIGSARRGYVIIPTKPDAKPIHYFDPIPPDRIQQYSDNVRFIIDGEQELKIGIAPEDLKDSKLAQIAYFYRAGEDTIALLMTSPTAPQNQEECMDPPRSDPNGRRGAVQAYNSDVKKSGLQFGEIEIQGAQATRYPDNRVRAQHIINLRAIRGDYNSVIGMISKFIKFSGPPLIFRQR